MNKILSSLLITAALLSSVVFAEDVLHTTMVDGKRRVDFTLNGKTGCVMVDDKIFCAPDVTPAPIKLASTVSN